MSSNLKSNYYLRRVDLTLDEVVDFKWNKLHVRMFEKKLNLSERNFIKRLRKRERNSRKYETDLNHISGDIQSLETEKARLKMEIYAFRAEIERYQELFFYQMHSNVYYNEPTTFVTYE